MLEKGDFILIQCLCCGNMYREKQIEDISYQVDSGLRSWIWLITKCPICKKSSWHKFKMLYEGPLKVEEGFQFDKEHLVEGMNGKEK